MNNDPYKVLGVSYDATDDQIKAAYLELIKKYHPDNYADSPLSDVANEKTQEINTAYDEIMNMRRGGQGGSGAYNSQANTGGYNGAYSGGSNLGDIRSLINQNRLVEAEELLDGIPAASRSGEWHFLKGTVFFSRGWLEEASNCWETAVRMEPGNTEYRAALNRVMWQRRGNFGGGYNGQYNTPRDSECTSCDICTSLMCADCCCHCMGGRGCC